MMTTWRVRVEFAPPDAAGVDIDATILTPLTEQLQQHDPTAVVETDGHIGVAITLEAGTRRTAFDRGDKTVGEALAAIGLADVDVVDVQVLTAAEAERRKRQPRVPRLAGVSEAAAICGVSDTRIKVLAEKNPDDLPLVQQLAGKTGTKIYLEESWREFAKKPRVRTGRPRGTGRKTADKPTEELGASGSEETR